MAKNMDNLPKIELTLLKKLVEQLEIGLEACEKIKNDEQASNVDFVIEMVKSVGLVTGIIQEGSMLVNDIQSVVRASQQPIPKSLDLLDKVLGGLKGAGGSTN